MRQDYDPLTWEFPTAVRYPYEAIEATFGNYLTSTPAYMLAMALYMDGLARAGREGEEVAKGLRAERIDEFRIVGVELAVGTEYFHQRACFEYYLGRALERGIKVTWPPTGTSLLNAPMYARDAAAILARDYKGEPRLAYAVKDGFQKVTVLEPQEKKDAVGIQPAGA